MTLLDKLRVPPGPVDLSSYSTSATRGFKGRKQDGEERLAELGPRLLDLQTKLFAHRGRSDAKRLLLVLQGMDTSGKGGVLKHTIGLVDPVGVRITSFKAPTAEERAHDFLWRIERAVPEGGYVGVFDRSHYEDVLIGRVRSLAPPDEIERRYQAISDFERRLVDDGTVVVKCMLHISPAEQKQRLLARLDDPTKHWKYNPGDVDERQLWDAYTEAYEIALERTNAEHAPWFIVPSDKKWYRNYAIAEILQEALESMGLDWPPADFDVAAERKRLAEDTIGERDA
ncbi:PPK2 family polyphosphate kinase [Nocardioides sp. CER19]|uniref:PPK2 family polyphosphate kinase n=1 Tax=Nocardioides sp. CER19 TaxID=3038538 RepID=UPI0024494F13|nr:PPK2 family polyphosphate kinase [Nocardioides sp. CER19]MDH2415849.1 polyphosphate kinase 2 family protein [Nocardioides sp. CER19]